MESDRTKDLRLRKIAYDQCHVAINNMSCELSLILENYYEIKNTEDQNNCGSECKDAKRVHAYVSDILALIDSKSKANEILLSRSVDADELRARTKFQGTLTHELLRNTLKYDSVTGEFTKIGDDGFASEPAAQVEGGRLVVKLFGTTYVAQDLAWFWLSGDWPDRITVADCDWLNCRMSNLTDLDLHRRAMDETS